MHRYILCELLMRPRPYFPGDIVSRMLDEAAAAVVNLHDAEAQS